MRRSDVRQQREYDESSREGQAWQEGGRREGQATQRGGRRDEDDYEERRKARELRHHEAEKRGYRMAVRARRQNSPAVEAGKERSEARYPRERRREDRHYGEERRYYREERDDDRSPWSWGSEDMITSKGSREVRQPMQEREGGRPRPGRFAPSL